MKTFEEKWTAWLDGQLSGKELTEFEASLPDLAAAEAEKRDALKLGAFLKEQLPAHALNNEEFFSHQLQERIARDTQDRERAASTWWTVPRLVWCGATALALFVVTTVVLMNQHPAGEQSEYLTQILNSRVDPAANPNATISIFESKNDNKDKVTVLWTEGLQTLPSDYAAK
jgi:anti-sigma factor RsiW